MLGALSHAFTCSKAFKKEGDDLMSEIVRSNWWELRGITWLNKLKEENTQVAMA